ncbi:hypothetical protein Tco_1138997 [Tanacetum coccineum]
MDGVILLRKISTVSLTAGGDPAIRLWHRCKWVSLSVIEDHEIECTLRHVVGVKSLLDAVWITVAHVFVNAAQLELVLLRDFKENMLSVYYF